MMGWCVVLGVVALSTPPQDDVVPSLVLDVVELLSLSEHAITS